MNCVCLELRRSCFRLKRDSQTQLSCFPQYCALQSWLRWNDSEHEKTQLLEMWSQSKQDFDAAYMQIWENVQLGNVEMWEWVIIQPISGFVFDEEKHFPFITCEFPSVSQNELAHQSLLIRARVRSLLILFILLLSLPPLTAVSHEESYMQERRLPRFLFRSWQHCQLPGLVSAHRRGGDLPVWVRGPWYKMSTVSFIKWIRSPP